MELITFLGRPHVFGVIFYTAAGRDRPMRFQEIMEASQVPRNTLVNRLKEMVQIGLLERTEYPENPPRVEYEATEKLLALEPVFKAMHEWCREWTLTSPESQADPLGVGHVPANDDTL